MPWKKDEETERIMNKYNMKWGHHGNIKLSDIEIERSKKNNARHDNPIDEEMYAEPFFVFESVRLGNYDQIILYNQHAQYIVFVNQQSAQPDFTISDRYVLDHAIEEFIRRKKL